jgi:Tfp pilus assembly protein PilN
MSVRTKTALGIDIGSRRLSMALVEKGEQGFRVLAAAGGDLPTPASEPHPPVCRKVLSRLFAQLGRRSRLLGTRAAVALAPETLVIQLLDLPRRMPANLGEFVTSELQQYVALSGKAVVSDFCGVGSGVRKRVLAVAADGDEIQEAIRAYRGTAARIDAVIPSALAYARAFLAREKGLPAGDHSPPVHQDILIAVLGAHTLTIAVFRKGTLDFVRLRQVPSDAHTPRLLCVWLAEELKAVVRDYDTQVGSPTPKSALGAPVSAPSRERRFCLTLHDSAYRADDLVPLLAAEAGTKTFTVADAYEPLLTSGPVAQESPSEGVSMVAVGAALTLLEAEGDDPRVNLLPKAVVEAKSLVRHALLMANIGVILFLGIFTTGQLLTRTTHAMDRRIEEARYAGELYTTPALMAKEKFLDQEIARLRQHVEPLRGIMKGRQAADWPDILDAVRQATPEDVSILQLQCNDGRIVSLQGLAPSCPAAEAFVRNLETQRPFASVSLVLVQERKNHSDRPVAPRVGPAAPLRVGVEYRIDCLLTTKGGVSS